jgi:hypothetical protein
VEVHTLAELLMRIRLRDDYGLSKAGIIFQVNNEQEIPLTAAVDSLSVAKWQNATLQLKDAFKALIEQRDRTQQNIFKNLDRAQLTALRMFDRLQAQKLRRSKSDKEEARVLIRRLEALMHQETEVASALADDGEKPAGDDAKSEQKPEEPAKAEAVNKSPE